MRTKKGLFGKVFLCVLALMMLAVVFTSCKIEDPVTEAEYMLLDNDNNYYNKDHTTAEEAVTEFTDSITALRQYLNSESFVDSGYYMGVNFDIDLLDTADNTVGNFSLRVKAYLYTYPYEDENGNPIYKYYENGQYYDENNPEGTRKLVSALEIHNEAIKKSDICIEWYDGAANQVLIGMYYDGLNGNVDDPGNVLYMNVQGYKRSFPGFGDTVLYQQLIRLLVNLSVEGLLEALGLQADAGTGSINEYMTTLVKNNYKRVVNGDVVSLLFDKISSTSDLVSTKLTELFGNLFGVFEHKWDPMTAKFLGFKFSTVAEATIKSAILDLQAIITPDKKGSTNNVLTDAIFAAEGTVISDEVLYTYTAGMRFDYGWAYPDNLTLDRDFYQEFDYGQYDFAGLLYVPAWDSQFDAVIRTRMQDKDNSLNNVFIEFRDIANGELMIGVYYRDERAYLDITGLSYMYGWVDLPALGFPQVYDEHLDLAEVLGKFFRMINRVIVSIVDGILDPSKSSRENNVLKDIMDKTEYSEKTEDDIFSINSEKLQIDLELIKQMLEETGAGTYSTRQIINILDSVMPYTMDQIAIMLGIASAEIMLEKTYFTLQWDVDKQHFTICMYTNVGVKKGEPSNLLFQLELDPVYFGDRRVTIAHYDFSRFKPLREVWTYSGTLNGTFIFSSDETVDISKLLSATIGESSGLNTPYILPSNTGLTFTLDYDQFVSDQKVDIVIKEKTYTVYKYQKRSAFHLEAYLLTSDDAEFNEGALVLQLSSDDVCFDNEVYKDLPAREDELGYIWVDIACVVKNGVQTIPKVKIREDVFMASMSAYMHKQTSIEDDVSSFADNDFNLSLTSIISALCKDAYVIPAGDKMEITSSNDTLRNLFRVDGLIGNIKVDAGFRTDDPSTENRVKGLETARLDYAMYQVGSFQNITGKNPYETKLHDTLPVYFYEDYLPAQYPLKELVKENGIEKENRKVYDPLEYDFYVFPENVVLDDGTMISAGTIYVFELGAKRTVSRQAIGQNVAVSAFFLKESAENQDITQVKFLYNDLILDPTKPLTNENRLVYEIEGSYYYRTYYGVQKRVKPEYVEKGEDDTIYIYWQGITEVVLYDSGTTYYYYDRNRAIIDEDTEEQAYIGKRDERKLLFVHDEDSVKITEDCKTQYAPRTNGSFMGEVRRYFIRFTSVDDGELGRVDSLYYNKSSRYKQYYNEADENNIVEIYDPNNPAVLLGSEKVPVMLYVMEPCEPLSDRVQVNVQTDATQTQLKEFTANYIIDWELASSDKKGYMVERTEVIVAPGMMGECSFPIRIIVLNREIDALGKVSIYPTEENVEEEVPVVDEIDIDPYEYAMAKYAFFSNADNFQPATIQNMDEMQEKYLEAVETFAAQYFAQKKYGFTINFLWRQSYLQLNEVGDEYVQKSYDNVDGDKVTPYAWSFDKYAFGTNAETSISPLGGTIYLHTTFYGQLIALKVNIGKREFSHLKFYSEDSFDPAMYNEDNMEHDPYIVGIYRANYYAEETYTIDDAPIFVFKDDLGNRYEYVFDMSIITGLQRNTDGSYAGVYEKLASYGILWGDPTISNITSNGSYYEEFSYSYLYSETDFTRVEMRYDSLGAKQKVVKVLNYDGTITDEYLYREAEDHMSEKRDLLPYADLLKVYRNDSDIRLYDEEATSLLYKQDDWDNVYAIYDDYEILYKENEFVELDDEILYDNLTQGEKEQTVRVLKSNGVIEKMPLYAEDGDGYATARAKWSNRKFLAKENVFVELETLYGDLTEEEKAETVPVLKEDGTIENMPLYSEDNELAVQRAMWEGLAFLSAEEKFLIVQVLKNDGTAEENTLYRAEAGKAYSQKRKVWAYAELSNAQQKKTVNVLTEEGLLEEGLLYLRADDGKALIRTRFVYNNLTDEQKGKVIVLLKDGFQREKQSLYYEEGGFAVVHSEWKIENTMYENSSDKYLHKEDRFIENRAYSENSYETILTLYSDFPAVEKEKVVPVIKSNGELEYMPLYVEGANGYTQERKRLNWESVGNEAKEKSVLVLYYDGTIGSMPAYEKMSDGTVGLRERWEYAELGNTYDFKYYKENDVTELTQTYNSLTEEEKKTMAFVLKDDGTVEEMFLYIALGNGKAGERRQWTYEELEAEHTEIASGVMIHAAKILFLNEGQFVSAGFGEQFTQDANGYVMTRKAHIGFNVDYGKGYEPKFKKNRQGYTLVRNTDIDTEKETVNRPYYYFTLGDRVEIFIDEEERFELKWRNDQNEYGSLGIYLSEAQYTMLALGLNYVYLTDEQFEAYADPANEKYQNMRKAFELITTNNETLTTAGLDLYHLFRIYFVHREGAVEQLYGISTLTNKMIPPEELDDLAIGKTDFRSVELRIVVECPQLEVAQMGQVKDDIRDIDFTYDKVNAGSNELGYYKVDPLNKETLFLPEELTIYFQYNGGEGSSLHTFTDVEWAADYRIENNIPIPEYSYPATGNDAKQLIEKVEEKDKDGNTVRVRYKVAIDVKKLEDVLTFYAKVKIGTEVSGYQLVTVAIKILSKDPTNIAFYSGNDENRKLLDTPRTKGELVTGGVVSDMEFYSYYVNTFEGFVLPDYAVATFSDGHEKEYELEWKSMKLGGQKYTFAPNTIVTLMTTIGDDEEDEEDEEGEGGEGTKRISFDLYLAVMVENYEFYYNGEKNIRGIEPITGAPGGATDAKTLGEYYVTVKNRNGQFLKNAEDKIERVKVNDLFQKSGNEVGYYYDGNDEYYIRISTGSTEEPEVEMGKIGLYNRNNEGEYVFAKAVSVYDFIMAAFKTAKLTLTKKELQIDQQSIVSDSITDPQQKSVFAHKIQLVAGNGETQTRVLRDVTTVTYKKLGEDEIISVSIGATDEAGIVFSVFYNSEGKVRVLTGNDRYERYMNYEELLIYIIHEYLGVNFIDNKNSDGDVVGWNIVRVNGSTTDVNGDPFTGTVKGYCPYGENGLEISERLGLTEGGTIVLRNNATGETVEMTREELVYRLTHYYKHLRIPDGTKTISTSFEINDLEKIMNVNDMLIRPRDENDGVPQGKYLISLGTGKGSYDIEAYLMFTDGIYLSTDSQSTEIINVSVYNASGEISFAGGYVLGDRISARVKAVINNGTGAQTEISYNGSATDSKLMTWYIEPIKNTINPVNIVDEQGQTIESGSLTMSIAARAIYSTGKPRQITISALTPEGFRIKRSIIFEELVGELSSGFNAGNPDVDFAVTNTFAVQDGKITIENIYDFTADPGIYEYLGSTKYLPKTVTVKLNGRQVTVSNVKWTINPAWYGAVDSRLTSLDYAGTGGAVLMATTTILGFNDPLSGELLGSTKLNLYLDIKSAEIRILPWEDEKDGCGLATETLVATEGKKKYVVYIDAYNDADAKKKGVIKQDEYGTYFELPSELLVEYTSGKYFFFHNTVYKFNGDTATVRKIYFDEKGIDINMMTSSIGDLSGFLQSALSERYLDLTADLGLRQKLDIRFYFHNKRIGEADYIVHYTDLYNEESGARVLYADLSLAQKTEEIVVGSGKLLYIEYTEKGIKYARKANLMYYYTTYYNAQGSVVVYSDDESMAAEGLDKEAILQGTENVKLYRENNLGYADIAQIVYQNIIPLISLDDQTIRAAVLSEKETDWNYYAEELSNGINRIRINYNLDNLISAAQGMRLTIEQTIDDSLVGLGANLDSLTTEYLEQRLASWVSEIPQIGAYVESELNTEEAFSEDDCYNFARVRVLAAKDELLSSYIQRIRNANRSGSQTAREKAIRNIVEDYKSELFENAYTKIIKDSTEREFRKVFYTELNGMTKEEYNNVVYYKNLVEANYDVDKAIEMIYKIRSFKSNFEEIYRNGEGLTENEYKKLKANNAEFVALQIGSYIADALEMGYGYTYEEKEYIVNGIPFSYDGLTEQQKGETIVGVGYFKNNTAAPIKKYTNDGGQAKIATRVYSYDKLAEAVIVQTLYNAYQAAYTAAFSGDSEELIPLSFTSEEDATKAGNPYFRMAYTVNRLMEEKLQLAAINAAGTNMESTQTYKISQFVSAALDQTTTISKKILRSYLLNVIHEAADFTTLGDESWTLYANLKNDIIDNSYLSITGYTASLNTIRRSMISGTSVSMTLKTLLEQGTKTFVKSVYAEAEYAGTIKKLQTINGQIIEKSKVTDEDTTVTPTVYTFNITKFTEAIEFNTALYMIEPYYLYREIPHKILVFFDDGYWDNGEWVTDRKEDVGGRPYVTTMETWQENSFAKNVVQQYQGGDGTIGGRITSAVTGNSATVRMAVIAENREEKEVFVTVNYIEEGIAFADRGGGAQKTEDNRYFMVDGVLSVKTISTDPVHTIRTNGIYFYEYDETFGGDKTEYFAKGVLKYTLAEKQVETIGESTTMTNICTFAGYDSNANVVYEFVTTYKNAVNREPEKQNLYVYNPFEFSAQKDMPQQVLIGGEYLKVKWTGVSVSPQGNLSSSGEQKVTGTIGNAKGQSVTIGMAVAQWGYSGFYRKTDVPNERNIEFTVDGEVKQFAVVSRNDQLDFYFSKYAKYSSEDYYLVFFTVRIYKDGGVKRIVFEAPDGARDARYKAVAERRESQGGFIRELFYPEDSRMVEYGTSDTSMIAVNNRKKYLIKWGDEKKAILRGSQRTIMNCSIYLGNDSMENLTLESLKSSDADVPTLSTFNLEPMEIQTITIEQKREQDTVETKNLFDQIESSLTAPSEQVPVIITPDGYLPTTGKITLMENFVHYNPDSIQVRFLWNQSLNTVIAGMSNFIDYAYPEVENAAKSQFAQNLIMTWDSLSAAEQNQIINLAKKYMREVVNAHLSTENYTDAECERDAYSLLAINERYNYSARDITRLRGGANNRVTAYLLVGVEGSTEVYQTQITLKAIFQDYTPITYYDWTPDGVGENISASLEGPLSELMKKDIIYIAVRKEYWDDIYGTNAYGENNTPYDNIGDNMYKLLQIEANRNAYDLNGTERIVSNDAYLIRVDNINWRYDGKRLVSESFRISGVTYRSDLLQLIVHVTDEE